MHQLDTIHYLAAEIERVLDAEEALAAQAA
jgi:hypothetical protein